MEHKRIRALCEGAVLLAAAQLLDYIKLWRMPWGGSVTLAMAPLVLYAVRWGVGRAMTAGFAFGVLQFLLGGGISIGWQSILGDYLLAYTAVGAAGLAHGKKGSVYTGTLLGSFGRFLVAWVVGATLWAAYMPEEFFGMTMTSPWVYSFLYNSAYMLPNMAVTLTVFAALQKPLGRYFCGNDGREAT